jgi:DNA-binding MarR family transcriptional regulator
MTQLIQRLERLVTRLADPDDGRAALIGITDHGQTLLDDRKRVRRERLTALLTTLTSDEECALWRSTRVALTVLRRLVANADCSPNSAAAHPSGAGKVETRPADQRKVIR